MKKTINSFFKALGILLCLSFVQVCFKTYFKAKRMEKERITNVNNSPYNDALQSVKERIDFKSEEDALEQLEKATDIDEKLKILADNLNESLPQEVDNLILSKVEQHKNREIRYCYIIPNKDHIPAESEWNKYKEVFLTQIKYSNDFKAFRRNKVTMSYAYYDSEGTLLRLIKISPKDYH